MSDLDKLLSLCKCGIYLSVNLNRDVYQSVKEYVEEVNARSDDEEISQGLTEKMIEADVVVELQFYPDTPVGFYKIYHYDVNEAIAEALEVLND